MLKLKFLHIELTREGKYNIAKRLLQFMIDKRIYLGLGNADYELESLLNKCGLKPVYVSSRSGYAEFRI